MQLNLHSFFCVCVVVLLCYIKLSVLVTGRGKSGAVCRSCINLHLLSAGAQAGISAQPLDLLYTPDPMTVTLSPSSPAPHVCTHSCVTIIIIGGFAVYVGRRAKSLRSARHVNYVSLPPPPPTHTHTHTHTHTRAWTHGGAGIVWLMWGGPGGSLVGHYGQSRFIWALNMVVDMVNGLWPQDFRVLSGICLLIISNHVFNL